MGPKGLSKPPLEKAPLGAPKGGRIFERRGAPGPKKAKLGDKSKRRVREKKQKEIVHPRNFPLMALPTHPYEITIERVEGLTD